MAELSRSLSVPILFRDEAITRRVLHRRESPSAEVWINTSSNLGIEGLRYGYTTA